MYYEFDITVPANTAKTNPVKQELLLCKGIIHRVEIQFPIGTRALVHGRLKHHLFGQLPTNPEGDFKADGYIIPIDENLEFNAEPYKFDAEFWSEADTYDYIVTVRVGIFKDKTSIFVLSVLKGLATFLKLMGIKV